MGSDGRQRPSSRPQDFGQLLDKLGALVKKDFDVSTQVAASQAPTPVVGGDADILGAPTAP